MKKLNGKSQEWASKCLLILLVVISFFADYNKDINLSFSFVDQKLLLKTVGE